MHNLHTIFVKIIDICRHFSNDLVNKFDRIMFETANIKLEFSYRPNLKDRKLLFVPFAKARKLIETIFSQSGDQFMLIRNYAKETEELFVRIIGKISALTVTQYINKIDNNPIERIKHEPD